MCLSFTLLFSCHIYLYSDLNLLLPCGQRQGKHILRLRQLRSLVFWWQNSLLPQKIAKSNCQMWIPFRPTHILLIGPVIEVHVVQVFGNHGLECDIPSPNNTSWVVISSGKSRRFVDEVHIPNAELRSSAELLTGHQKAGGGESCLGLSKTSIQETGAVHVTSPTSIKETCADSVSFSPSPVYLYTKRTIPTTERKCKNYSCQFIVKRRISLNEMFINCQ